MYIKFLFILSDYMYIQLLFLINRKYKFSVYLRYSFAHDVFVFLFCDVFFGIMGFEN